MNNKNNSNVWLKIAIPVLIGLLIWFSPVPDGVEPRAWHLLAIFIATIVGIITQPMPMGAVAFIAIVITALSGVLTVHESLSGFGNPVIWLIVCAFMISRGFVKTGLGARIAYWLMTKIGKHSLGLAYGFVATDLLLAPAIPSNTARAGGIILPVIRSTARVYDSTPEAGTTRRLGSFLVYTSFQVQNITCAMFMTAMAANPLIVQLAGDLGVDITWTGWALAAIVPGLISLALIPLVIYKFNPPEIKHTPAAADLGRSKLEAMGKMKSSEWILLGVFFLLLTLWIFGRQLGMHSATAALTGLAVLILSGVLSWEDVLQEKGAWNTLVWFAALVMMASFLGKLGLIGWFSEWVQGGVTGTGWVQAFLVLSLVYFYSHYFFASNTAHISSMYAPFLAVAIAVGTPAMLAALVLAFFSNLWSSMTHYGTGPAPVFWGSDYVEMGTWWKVGFLISLVNIVVWLGVGGLWWKLLGLW